ncbi:transforming growth factor beta regulator 1-like isoform X1 [Macrosteles quadrilineatus]|uniref:transforming growth factor beta regulator 1-like isoform X1 n=1 Tax=Macrosteles quadrilineatus TaxID=74068 RepID=UPI0023E1AF03|nr:transforming growth factor beta regulator 1-like isoform X1 [Macrosteles quadrilineatus]
MFSYGNSSSYSHKFIKQEDPISEQEKYKRKYKFMKRAIKDVVFENAALCDQVTLMEEKILLVKEERNYLLKKLQMFNGITEGEQNNFSRSSPNVDHSIGSGTKKPLNKKRSSESTDSMKSASKAAKKSPATKRKKVLHTIPLDITGRPKFPIKLGDLTVHSLGEVLADRPEYHTDDLIFPVGYCSTRTYGSLKDPEKQCVYTCTILDGGTSPRFEIVADSDLKVIGGYSLDECHAQLLQEINRVVGTEVVNTRGRGADFFGLSHPTIHHLIQSSPGVRKCHGYVWTKFDLSRASEGLVIPEQDAALSYEALLRTINFTRTHLIKQEPEDSYGENNVTTFQNLLLN